MKHAGLQNRLPFDISVDNTYIHFHLEINRIQYNQKLFHKLVVYIADNVFMHPKTN